MAPGAAATGSPSVEVTARAAHRRGVLDVLHLRRWGLGDMHRTTTNNRAACRQGRHFR
jgi:hypothetical protein